MTIICPTHTLKEAREILRTHNMVLRHSVEWDEFRVNFKGGTKAEAYYCSDLDDALETGIEMAERLETKRRQSEIRRQVMALSEE